MGKFVTIKEVERRFNPEKPLFNGPGYETCEEIRQQVIREHNQRQQEEGGPIMNTDKYFSLDEYKRQKEAEENLATFHRQQRHVHKLEILGLSIVYMLLTGAALLAIAGLTRWFWL